MRTRGTSLALAAENGKLDVMELGHSARDALVVALNVYTNSGGRQRGILLCRQ